MPKSAVAPARNDRRLGSEQSADPSLFFTSGHVDRLCEEIDWWSVVWSFGLVIA